MAATQLKTGIRAVVAMGYNLYVSAARQFVPAFYYCNAVVADLGLKPERDDSDYGALMEALDGHPLAVLRESPQQAARIDTLLRAPTPERFDGGLVTVPVLVAATFLLRTPIGGHPSTARMAMKRRSRSARCHSALCGGKPGAVLCPREHPQPKTEPDP